MIDEKLLLSDLQDQVHLLEVDLRRQVDGVAEHAQSLRTEFDEQRRVRRTAAEWPEWRDAQLTQVAVAWVLSTVFLRWTEDNGLIDPTLTGPGERGQAAEEAQAEYFRDHRDHNDAVWLEGRFEALRAAEAGRLLFDRDHNPLYLVPISHDAARNLIAFWRYDTAEGLRHDFTDPSWDTRFLGDLYQDLSETARKQYALLQTPRFVVEPFILERTMTPAVQEFGLQNFRMIDPACGSGHFLLDAFERLVEAWREEATLDPYELATTALASVHGVDLNPFAVGITRFRISLAAWKVAGIRRLEQTQNLSWRPVIACGDSLRSLARQGTFESIDEHVGIPTMFEDVYRYHEERLLEEGSYHAVVGNPPYITPEDARDADAYRQLWSACHRQFQLSVPFAQLFFRLARPADHDGRGAGFTGQITSNAFTKREFGSKLVEEFFPTVTLDYVIDSSGAYVPGHGTPTVLLIGRRRRPRLGATVRVVLGIRGEPQQPSDPSKGIVWNAIVDQVEYPGSESDWVSVVDLPQDHFATHPWSLAGGGASNLLAAIEERSDRLASRIKGHIGFASFPAADDVFVVDRPTTDRQSLSGTRPVVIGESVRDWAVSPKADALAPYGNQRHELLELSELSPSEQRHLWQRRRTLQSITSFGGVQRLESGESWWSWYRWVPHRYQTSLSITFAEIATACHFALDRGGNVFNRSAPVLKLSAEATEGDHLELLGALNSSTACFWMKQNCFPKGGSGIGRGIQPEDWMERFVFNATNLERLPLPNRLPLEASRRLSKLAHEVSACSESMVTERSPARHLLNAAHDHYRQLRARMIAEQEELDWEVYDLYGLLSDAERAEVVVADPTETPGLQLGERAFEIVLARQVAAGRTETQWFARHGSTPITELPTHWPDWYRTVVERRIALIERRADIALIERPECKRRWASEPWAAQQERALRSWLLDRLETRALWFAPDDSGVEQPNPHTVATLADALRADEDFVSVAGLWAQDALQRADVDLAEVVAALIDDEHVPFLAAYRYKGKGLDHRRAWEHTWDRQRQEDRVAAELGFDDPTHPEVRERVRRRVGEVPVPPKYGSGDFVRPSYWRHRGKLDVPKERFVSYPAASREGDGSLLLGWAGWDHRKQAQALAVLITARRSEDGWDDERVLPLLAGLAEVMPWVRQWHGEIDPDFGMSPAEAYDGFLDGQLVEIGRTRAQLASWAPVGRVDVSPLPRRRAGGTATEPRERAPRAARTVDPAHRDAVLAAASHPLSNEDIRGLTGLDAAGARAVATSLVRDGRLTTIGQRRGTRYVLADATT